MKKKSSFFYSGAQVAEIRDAIDNNVSATKFAKEKAREWGKTPISIAEKMRKVKQGWSSEGKVTKAYTDAQVQLLKHAIFRGNKTKDIVKRYAGEWNRGKPGLMAKIFSLKKEMMNTSPKQSLITVKKDVIKQKEENPQIKDQEPEVGTTLPKGFKFEGDSKKVVLYSDHFRVYF